MNKIKKILIDENHYLFDKQEMQYREFKSDYRLVRFYAKLLADRLTPGNREDDLLEQQISELIRNAIKHGNKKDASKVVRVWFKSARNNIRMIVEDQGEGFRDLEKWNEFNCKKCKYYYEGDIEKLADYVSFRSAQSGAEDGGNALFAAVEYWDLGVVFNSKKNAVAIGKTVVDSQLLFSDMASQKSNTTHSILM